MKPHVVADVGNSRIKWGLCSPDGRGLLATASLPDDPAAWRDQLDAWRGTSLLPGAPALDWVLASVVPGRCDRLRDWLRGEGHRSVLLSRAEQLPLTTRVADPNRVGIDRLLDAVAAKRRLASGEPAVLVDAGSAVTVDWLDGSHTFCGGAIYPGLRLMARALNDHTALLPLVTVRGPVPAVPAPETVPAMEAGIFHAVVGGIEKIVRSLAARSPVPARLFVTGGDAALLVPALDTPVTPVLWPDQTLEGILAAAEALGP